VAGKDVVVVLDGVTWGSDEGCRLCTVQSIPFDRKVSHSGGRENASKAAGWIKYRVEAVIRMTTKGTSSAAHLVFWPMRRFWSCEEQGEGLLRASACTNKSLASCRKSSSFGLKGRGDGGGVNMIVGGEEKRACSRRSGMLNRFKAGYIFS